MEDIAVLDIFLKYQVYLRSVDIIWFADQIVILFYRPN